MAQLVTVVIKFVWFSKFDPSEARTEIQTSINFRANELSIYILNVQVIYTLKLKLIIARVSHTVQNRTNKTPTLERQ